MENNKDELISKKDLLLKYNISYGALYRWKRKGLIPDDWFIRKSTNTGQETYFNKSVICERVEAILALKNQNTALEDMANIFNPTNDKSHILNVTTKYGEKSFNLSELLSVTLTVDENNTIDILKIIKEKI